jgi:ubiquinol-cytochrome c reductase cytochrome c subunit
MTARSLPALVTVALLLAAAAAAAQSRSSEGPEIRSGAELYADGCIGCHGPQARGVAGLGPAAAAGRTQGAGPSLRDVGAASLHFYLTTGYMPLRDPDEPPERSTPSYSPQEIEAIIAYVESLSAAPAGPDIPVVHPERGDLQEGLRAFTASCAGCHQVVAEGGVVLDGVAPELERATPTQIAEAIRVGPYLMPKFSEAQISDAEVDSIVRYIRYASDPRDEGGWGLGHIGPIPEGLVAWIIAGIVLVGVMRIIGKRIA